MILPTLLSFVIGCATHPLGADGTVLGQDWRQRARTPRVALPRTPRLLVPGHWTRERERRRSGVCAGHARVDLLRYAPPELTLSPGGKAAPSQAQDEAPPDELRRSLDTLKPLIDEAVADAAGLTWMERDLYEWSSTCLKLRYLAQEMGPPDPAPEHWPADGVEPWPWDDLSLRRRAFLLHGQIGRTAETSCHPSPPYFQMIGDTPVNYHYWLAGSMAQADPDLWSWFLENPQASHQEIIDDMGYYIDISIQHQPIKPWRPNGG